MTDSIGTVGVQTAMRAGVAYLAQHGLDADGAALAECLRSHVQPALPAALRDAIEALDARMGGEVASLTFQASMALAGIEAAKEASLPTLPALVG